ncbi:MAG: hypothetical protein M3408_04710, partial [Actinomycetota bacterium]|nr:hypothetical protein [Actinomycetota bacterium]
SACSLIASLLDRRTAKRRAPEDEQHHGSQRDQVGGHGEMPFSNWAQIRFPAVVDAIRKLTDWGVTVLVGDDVYPQHEPGTGEHYVHLFPWHLAWQAVLDHP